MKPEIVTERGEEILRAERLCGGRLGPMHMHPRYLWVNAVTGKVCTANPGGKLHALGYKEEKEMVALWLAERGVSEPKIEGAEE